MAIKENDEKKEIFLEDDPEEQAVIALMQELRRSRMSYAKIAEELDSRNIPTRCGGKWQTSTVYDILKGVEDDKQREEKEKRKKEDKPRRAWCYIRCSTDDQAEKGLGLEAQAEKMKGFVDELMATVSGHTQSMTMGQPYKGEFSGARHREKYRVIIPKNLLSG